MEKQTYLSGPDLATLLKSMQSSNLDQIEIMTNPPAKYDAAGNSGIINIKTKKNVIKGMNGSAGLNYSQGRYSTVNPGFNLNYRNDKLNLFGGYNLGNYEGFNQLTITRNFYAADQKTLIGVLTRYPVRITKDSTRISKWERIIIFPKKTWPVLSSMAILATGKKTLSVFPICMTWCGHEQHPAFVREQPQSFCKYIRQCKL